MRNVEQGKGWAPATINVRYVTIQAPPSILPEINVTGTIWASLNKLSQANLLRPFDQTAGDDCRFTITPEGIGIFRKHLLPVKLVKDKKSYNGLIDKIQGNPETKKELKQLGDKLRDKLEDEAIEGFIKFALKVGSDALIYYVNMIPH
ncbi:MAG: hypothetical protein KGI28_02545 [Thaumarchaeota archaeon]|nr:hypothetical protein [Nitrososphaerota archaeon]